MAIRQLTIVGTGLIGGSLGLALKAHGFRGRIMGSDRAPVLERAKNLGAIDSGAVNPVDAIRGSQVVVLAAPVGAIIALIDLLGPSLPAKTLLTDVGSTKAEILVHARRVFGKNAPARFLAGHPMAGKEQSGVENADPQLFQKAAWLVTPIPGQNLNHGLIAEFLEWIEKIGAEVAELDPKNAQTWYLLGASLVYKMTTKKVGNKEEVQFAPGTIEAYEKAVELDPNGTWGQQAKQGLEQLQLMAPGIETKVNLKKKKS